MPTAAEVPREYVATMYELMHLAFLFSTRVATYQIASMGDATTLGGKFMGPVSRLESRTALSR